MWIQWFPLRSESEHGELHIKTSRGRIAVSYNSCGKNRICSSIHNYIFVVILQSTILQNLRSRDFFTLATAAALRHTESTTFQCLYFTEVIPNSNHKFVAVNASHWRSVLGREDLVNLCASRSCKMKFRVAACACCSHCNTTTSQVRERQRWHGRPRISPA